jgi:hypothetical protein
MQITCLIHPTPSSSPVSRSGSPRPSSSPETAHRRPHVSQLPYHLVCLGMAPIYSFPYRVSSLMPPFISLCPNVPISGFPSPLAHFLRNVLILAPAASLWMAGRAVVPSAIRTFPETSSTKDVQLFITDVIRSAGVEAALAGQRIHFF